MRLGLNITQHSSLLLVLAYKNQLVNEDLKVPFVFNQAFSGPRNTQQPKIAFNNNNNTVSLYLCT